VPATLESQNSDGRPAAAVGLFRQALQHQAQNQSLEAARCYAQALHSAPDFFEAAFNLGLLFQKIGRLEGAIECYSRAVRLRPDYVAAWSNQGLALRDLGRNPEAVTSLEHARRLAPASASVLNNLGNAPRSVWRHDEAIAAFREALRYDAGNAGIHENLGNALRETGQAAEAEASLERAVKLQPDLAEAHWDLAFARLLQGDLAQGLEEYEWRWRRPDFSRRSFGQPLWKGEDLAGRTLLVHTEQGAGDAIQFVRFTAALAGRGGRILLECPRALAALFASAEGISEIIVRGDRLPGFDWQVPLLSVPHRLGTRLETIPARVPYLRAGAERQISLPTLPVRKGALKVGLVWQGNPKHKNDRNRSISLRQLEPLLGLNNIAYYSLQPESSDLRSDQIGQAKIADLSGSMGDYADTAALVEQLDLVLAVDTSVAHLAGALGRPVWVLLSFAPDWRWLTEREDSPWYPTARLFRQPAAGDWASVIERVGAELGRVAEKIACER